MNVLGITDERRKVAAALVASIAVHISVVAIVFWVNHIPFSTLPEPVPATSPVRITIIEPPPQPEIPKAPALPPPKPKPRFADAPSAVARGTPPPDTTTQSDADSAAASETTGKGPSDTPNLDGLNEKHLALENRRLIFSPGANQPPAKPPSPPAPTQPALAAKPAPPPPEQTKSARQPIPTPAPRREVAFNELPRPSRHLPDPAKIPLLTEVPDGLVVLDPSQAPPAPSPPPEPAQIAQPPSPPSRLALESAMPRATVQEQQIRSKVAGGATRRGPAALDAVGTPIGRYRKIMAQSINARWQAYVARQMDLVTLGTVKVRFDLLRDGSVNNVEVVSNDANSTLATVSIQAIMEAKIPPIPPDLAGALKDGRLEIEYTFNVW